MQTAFKSITPTHVFVTQDTRTSVTHVRQSIIALKTPMAVTIIQTASILDLESTIVRAQLVILEMGQSVSKLTLVSGKMEDAPQIPQLATICNLEKVTVAACQDFKTLLVESDAL